MMVKVVLDSEHAAAFSLLERSGLLALGNRISVDLACLMKCAGPCERHVDGRFD